MGEVFASLLGFQRKGLFQKDSEDNLLDLVHLLLLQFLNLLILQYLKNIFEHVHCSLNKLFDVQDDFCSKNQLRNHFFSPRKEVYLVSRILFTRLELTDTFLLMLILEVSINLRFQSVKR